MSWEDVLKGSWSSLTMGEKKEIINLMKDGVPRISREIVKDLLWESTSHTIRKVSGYIKKISQSRQTRYPIKKIGEKEITDVFTNKRGHKEQGRSKNWPIYQWRD
tara:strand:- start:266 stop:580 length:315 start_codon:yes stop_codon:yes gene_type:complete